MKIAAFTNRLALVRVGVDPQPSWDKLIWPTVSLYEKWNKELKNIAAEDLVVNP